MAITIIATPGAADANSYATEVELDAWIEKRLFNSAAVTGATSDTKKKTLIAATRLLDQNIDWDGDPEEPTVQALQWPRINLEDDKGNALDGTEIPDRIKEATCELACSLMDANLTSEVATAGIDRIKAGPVELEFSETAPPSRKVFPDTVFQMVAIWGEKEYEGLSYIEAERG